LDDVALALGIPGKIGGQGSEVQAMVRRGEIDNVRAYSEGDCLNLFVLYVAERRNKPGGSQCMFRPILD
jgi:hypothetical protein